MYASSSSGTRVAAAVKASSSMASGRASGATSSSTFTEKWRMTMSFMRSFRSISWIKPALARKSQYR